MVSPIVKPVMFTVFDPVVLHAPEMATGAAQGPVKPASVIAVLPGNTFNT